MLSASLPLTGAAELYAPPSASTLATEVASPQAGAAVLGAYPSAVASATEVASPQTSNAAMLSASLPLTGGSFSAVNDIVSSAGFVVTDSQQAGSATPVGIRATQMRGIYNVVPVYPNGNGATTIAIVDEYYDPNIITDLTTFDTAMYLSAPPSISVVTEYGGTNLSTVPTTAPNSGNNAILETSMDVEWAHAMAPGANILLVECGTGATNNVGGSVTNGDMLQGIQTAGTTAGVSAVSMSFGWSEGTVNSWGTSEEQVLDSAIFTTPTTVTNGATVSPFVHCGVTFVAASGDNGAPAQYPAYSPNVVAVGGTTLDSVSGSTYPGETTWSGSGGGASVCENEPEYQAGYFTRIGPGVPATREAPDVAFDANPSTGVAVCDSWDYGAGGTGPWSPSALGGTSLGAPCWAGIIADANQGRLNNKWGTPDGASQTLPTLYSPYTLGGNLPFHQITSGTQTGSTVSASAGYDTITGLGSPNANVVEDSLAAPTTLATIGLEAPSGTTFFLRNADASGGADETFVYGATGDAPITGDWDGNGSQTAGMWVSASNAFYLKNENAYSNGNSNYADYVISCSSIVADLGGSSAGLIPIAGDWGNWGRDSVGLYNPSTSDFALISPLPSGTTSGNASLYTPVFQFGGQGWGAEPLAGDWMGGGSTNGTAGPSFVGIYVPSSSYFFLANSTTGGNAYQSFNFGPTGQSPAWQPIAGDWVDNGFATVGLYAPASSTFFLRNSFSGGVANETIAFGYTGANLYPLAGGWGNASWTGAPGELVLAGTPPVATAGLSGITSSQLQPIVGAAVADWAAAGASPEALATMNAASFQITTLASGDLSRAEFGTVYLDATADGYGWLVDPDPTSTTAFGSPSAGGQSTAIDPNALAHIDLLTVVENELGQIAGLSEVAGASTDIMSGTIGTGIRRDPSATDAALLTW